MFIVTLNHGVHSLTELKAHIWKHEILENGRWKPATEIWQTYLIDKRYLNRKRYTEINSDVYYKDVKTPFL